MASQVRIKMPINKEKMSKLLQTLQKKGVTPQLSEESVEMNGLKNKIKRKKKKKDDDFGPDDPLIPPSMT